MSARGREAVTHELRDRIVSGMHVGQLAGGDRLPSVRELSADFEVNERVVLAALRALSDEGLVELRPRSGAYVAQQRPLDVRLPYLSRWLVQMLVQARSRGLAPREVAAFVRRSLATKRIRASCIECNLDQLHLLCNELSEDHGVMAEGTPLDAIETEHPPPSVERADVLVTTAFHADKVRRIARALGKPWIAVTLRPDIMRDVSRRLQDGPVYFVATDAKYERKLRRMLGPLGSTANLRVLLVPHDDLRAIPPNAPTFVMTSARAHVHKVFGSKGAPGKPIQPARHFSDESARDLLTFIVQANSASSATG